MKLFVAVKKDRRVI